MDKDKRTVAIWIILSQILCIMYVVASINVMSPMSFLINGEVPNWMIKSMDFLLFYGLAILSVTCIISIFGDFRRWKRNREYERKHYSEVMQTILNTSDTEDVKKKAISLLVPKKYRVRS